MFSGISQIAVRNRICCVPNSMQSANYTLFDFIALDSIQICCLMNIYKIFKMNNIQNGRQNFQFFTLHSPIYFDDFDVSKMFGYGT